MKLDVGTLNITIDACTIFIILKGLFCMLAIWFGIWLENSHSFIHSIFGDFMVGAALGRLMFILIKELW